MNELMTRVFENEEFGQVCKNRHPSPICTRFEPHFHALKPHLHCLSFKLPRSGRLGHTCSNSDAERHRHGVLATLCRRTGDTSPP